MTIDERKKKLASLASEALGVAAWIERTHPLHCEHSEGAWLAVFECIKLRRFAAWARTVTV